MYLFVYGIFLVENTGRRWDLEYIHYDTVRDFATRGSRIVEAVPAPGFTLTGLVTRVPDDAWRNLDRIERRYKRILVETEGFGAVFMYVSLDTPGENFSTWWEEQ